MTSDQLLIAAPRPVNERAHTAPPRSPREVAPELAEIGDLTGVAPADARDLTRVLLVRLAGLEEGTREYSYVRASLVELNLSLVRFALRRFGSHRESTEDLMQVGAVGLIKAIDRFETERGLEFTTFAIPTILGELRRHFRDTTWAVHVPRRLQELRLTLARAQDALSQTLDRAPTVAELSEYLGMAQDEVIEGLQAANAHSTDSLDVPAGSDGDGPGAFAAKIGSTDERLDMVEDLVSLQPLIAALPERDRLILSMRFTEDLTQSQIGERLGLSQMHVSRLLSRALAKLRQGLEAA